MSLLFFIFAFVILPSISKGVFIVFVIVFVSLQHNTVSAKTCLLFFLFVFVSLPYNGIFGGVSALSKEHMEKVNGFSNKYFGWGGEDDDMYQRFDLLYCLLV